jgi:NAD-dependent deacetylase
MIYERAGSKSMCISWRIITKVRSTKSNYILDWTEDLNFDDLDNNNNQLRPHIVWFGEFLLLKKQLITETADYFAVIGTSLQVYPAAGLIDFTNSKILFITLIQNHKNSI